MHGIRALGNKYRLQQATYHDIKERFGLTAQVVIRLLAKVADAYKLDKSRKRYERIRAKLQAAGTKSAKRHLKKLSGKERRFKRDTNHVLSKRIVSKAKRSDRGIALEDLKGIRQRTGKRLRRRSQRGRHGKWAFGELRGFLEYKARLAGVALVCVDPAYTSQGCSECGYCDRANRRLQSEFICKGCGHVAHADTNAALNIRSRASVMVPIVSDADSATHAPSGSSRDKPAALAVGS